MLKTEAKSNAQTGDDFVQHFRQRIESQLQQRFRINPQEDERLQSAMMYSLINGGKRIRGLLVYASAQAITTYQPLTDAAAIALEAIHAYSLIHDDLPAMDDDDLRRGQPTCHIAFDEATAILAGDALQSLAFEWLSETDLCSDSTLQLGMLNILAKASGDKGMGAGQAIDLAAVNQQLSLDTLMRMHQLKTGALISASVTLGALSTGAASEPLLAKLAVFSHAIGLAFQIQDDILDVTADTSTLGKTQGADIAKNKPTFVSLLGVENAQQQAIDLHQEALAAIASFDERANGLRYLANYIIQRPY